MVHKSWLVVQKGLDLHHSKALQAMDCTLNHSSILEFVPHGQMELDLAIKVVSKCFAGVPFTRSRDRQPLALHGGHQWLSLLSAA